MDYSFFIEPPAEFASALEAAGCYCEFDDKLLFLKRVSTKPQGNTWGVPGGKLEKGETPRAAVVREIAEEVGLDIDRGELMEVGRVYIRVPKTDYVFHLFRIRFCEEPLIHLGLAEHEEARWVTFADALQLPLISGGREALEYYRNNCSSS